MKRAVGRQIVVALILYALFFAAGFTGIQSMLLLGVVGWLYNMISTARQDAQSPFVPYRVAFYLHIEPILADFEVLKGEWPPELQASIDDLPQEPWNIWESRLLEASVLSRDLVFNHGWNSFSSDIDLHAILEPVAITQDAEVIVRASGQGRDRWSHPPRLNVSRNRLTITLLSGFWDKVRHKEPLKGLHAAPDPHTGTVDVELATIPDEEYEVNDDWHASDAEARLRRKEAVRLRDEARRRHGWRGEAQAENDFEPPLTAEESSVAKHRYMTVIRSEL